jgi:hypothetical protein
VVQRLLKVFWKMKLKFSLPEENIRQYIKVSLMVLIRHGKIFIAVGAFSPFLLFSFNYPIAGIMKIPKSEAAMLPNRTYPIHYEPGYYLAGLDVFHQLHCLVSPSSLLATI